MYHLEFFLSSLMSSLEFKSSIKEISLSSIVISVLGAVISFDKQRVLCWKAKFIIFMYQNIDNQEKEYDCKLVK